ncbi:hypothetical protein SAMN03159463_04222 [Mesorhizobium sp. NFR06]|uniref:hypothetical protein n=1 Tax=Mesorhizobium sp. NFR06 TaxID=1566290 RepID=UPI0008E4583A|nr:hypothetical protein [Mesorhizobium sp. NFR06]SFP44755.1 hypothetical protein SAMN03159463_04222 [Mesorhizobium sp. NFR06]
MRAGSGLEVFGDDASSDAGRGFITFNLHWKHDREFMGLAPTFREGSSVETLLLTIRANKIVRIDVADTSLDLAICLWDRGWPHPHNWMPPAFVAGMNRRRAWLLQTSGGKET